MILIGLSSLKLVVDTFFDDNTPEKYVRIFNTIDKIFNYAFLFEMLIKMCAIGFIMDDGSYLRESWNQLDFFIVVSSMLDMLLEDLKVDFIKILRLLRVLRPLRFISHNLALKMIVVALLESVGGIVNVIIVVVMVWLIFAIIGVNTFGGAFYYCDSEEFYYILHT